MTRTRAPRRLRVAFDTSVLVAGLVEGHPEFSRAAPWLDAVDRGEVEAVWTTHAYAETWSVLTRLPLADRLDPATVNEILRVLVAGNPPEPLTLTDYLESASRCAAAGVRSGAIFDALHLVLAERCGADALLTLNVKDFTRLSPRIRALAPPETVTLQDPLTPPR